MESNQYQQINMFSAMPNCSIDCANGTSAQAIDFHTYNLIRLLLEPSRLFIGIISLLLIVYGSFLSLKRDPINTGKCHRAPTARLNPVDIYLASLGTIHVLCTLLLGTCITLLMWYFCFELWEIGSAVIITIIATVSLIFLLMSLCYSIRPCTNASAELLSVALALALMCAWVLNGHWILVDVMGMGMCVRALMIFRPTSLKAATLLLLVVLLLIDFADCVIFISKYYYDANIKSATNQFANPVGLLARKFNVSFAKDAPDIILPIQLSLPCMLRPGFVSSIYWTDVVIPGLLLCFVHRYDVHKMSLAREVLAAAGDPIPSGIGSRLAYFHCSLSSMCGFCLGLYMSPVSSVVLDRSERDLFFLVTLTQIPVMATAYHMGELRQIWSDPFKKHPAPEYLEDELVVMTI